MAGAGWAPPRLDEFILTEPLGSGTYATVYKAYRKVGPSPPRGSPSAPQSAPLTPVGHPFSGSPLGVPPLQPPPGTCYPLVGVPSLPSRRALWVGGSSVVPPPRQRDTREVVAIKCVNKRSLNRASVENLLTEIEILKTIRHPNIVELKDFQVGWGFLEEPEALWLGSVPASQGCIREACSQRLGKLVRVGLPGLAR